jgi:hypothetical protein
LTGLPATLASTTGIVPSMVTGTVAAASLQPAGAAWAWVAPSRAAAAAAIESIFI